MAKRQRLLSDFLHVPKPAEGETVSADAALTVEASEILYLGIW